MKKLDKLIVNAFLGPFFLTFVVVVFILLTIYLLSYIEDFLGKNLGFVVFSELIFYFSINMVPAALPLAVLLSSLMTFGNLGEHHELTAVKASGISLIRAIMPIFIIVLFLTSTAFYFNNTIVPKANLKAFSLLYDIRQKKPAIDFKEGSFYNGLPGYSIKVNKKFPDGHSLKGIMIYNHTGGRGNTDLIVADSGAMFTFNHEQYLSLELFNGTSYTEYTQDNNDLFPKDFIRNNFQRSKIVFSLASFVFNKTPEQLFASNRKMKNVTQLTKDSDSLSSEYELVKTNVGNNLAPFYGYHLFDEEKVKAPKRGLLDRMDSIKALVNESNADSILLASRERNKPLNKIPFGYTPKDTSSKKDKRSRNSKKTHSKSLPIKNNVKFTKDTVNRALKARDTLTPAVAKDFTQAQKTVILSLAAGQARSIKSTIAMYLNKMDEIRREGNAYEIERDRKFTQSIACLIMFLLGAPLGAIIRKGGFGFPVLISIIFFILFYVLSIIGEKFAKEDVTSVWLGMWTANIVLFLIGLFFLRQAKNDSRLFEGEFYSTIIKKVTTPFKKVFGKQ